MGTVLPQPLQFGKYTLFERIGRGGMADVFKARLQGPASFERIFVVKRILPHLSDDPTFIRMFIEEAKLSARLSHPNIVQVFELGSVDGEYFISLDYVRGRDLAETMRALWARMGPPRPELVGYIGREMCRALAYAHDLVGDDGTPLGMIHRDLSPSNVMLSYEGAVQILDFGIAKALGTDSREAGVTQRGMLKGKFGYMAPEQTMGVDVDRRIDIFAAGIVLHEILTGRRLFKGDNDLQTMERVRQCDVPPPSLQNPLCPPALDAIVLRSLAKHRENRFPTASEMAEALDDVVHAARFQPAHLAQIMRDLFPADASSAEASRTGPAHVTHQIGGVASRPASAPSRSSTIPPVSHSVSGVRAPVANYSSLAAVQQATRFWKRGSVWAMAGLVALAFAGGAIWRSLGSAPRGAGPAQEAHAVLLDLVIHSIPSGADVYVLDPSEYLGRTPVKKKFNWREDRPTVLLFRLPGYEEIKREVKPNWTGFVTLKPLGATSRPAATPGPAAAPSVEPRPTAPPRPSVLPLPEVRSGAAAKPVAPQGKRRAKHKAKTSRKPRR